MKHLAILALAALAGCATQPQLVEVKVPVPVPCPAQEPQRPAMPTDSLPLGSSLPAKVRALEAEIELRDGYEIRLLEELRGCIKPATPPP